MLNYIQLTHQIYKSVKNNAQTQPLISIWHCLTLTPEQGVCFCNLQIVSAI
jgi:hypothetical protein